MCLGHHGCSDPPKVPAVIQSWNVQNRHTNYMYIDHPALYLYENWGGGCRCMLFSSHLGIVVGTAV